MTATKTASFCLLGLFLACSSEVSPEGSPAPGSSTAVGGSSAGGSSSTVGSTTGGTTEGGVTTTGVAGSGTVTSDSTSSSTSGSTSAGGATSGSTTGDVSTTGAGGTLSGSGGVPSGGAPNVGDPIVDRLTVTESTTPAPVKDGVQNWRVWGRGDLQVAPVFTVPLANCGTLVCYTTDSGGLTARAAYLDVNDELVTTIDLDTGKECRGLAAEANGNFAALLWDDGTDQIFVARFDATGAELSTTELVNGDNHPTDFDIGESRLEYGNGRYGAYYHVHSDSGHEGDTLKWVDAASGAEDTEWSWGCSHSMSNLLRFNPALSEFMPACVTDCYPGTDGSNFATDSLGGIYLDHQASKVMDVAAGCNGSVAGELGGAALSPNGWKLVFNAHQAPTTLGQSSYNESTMNQDIGFASIASDLAAGEVVWLTSTADIDEADASIARWEPDGDTAEQYVMGWSEAGSSHQLLRVDAQGGVLEGPVALAGAAAWGRRDDPFRQHVNKDVVWAWFDEGGSTTLKFARLRSGQSATCATF